MRFSLFWARRAENITFLPKITRKNCREDKKMGKKLRETEFLAHQPPGNRSNPPAAGEPEMLNTSRRGNKLAEEVFLNYFLDFI